MWWLHEPGSVGEHYLREEPKLRAAMPMADLLLAPSERTASIYRPYTESPVKCLHNAIPDVGERPLARAGSAPLSFLLMASIEPRKGQDVFVRALAQLPSDVQEAAQFEIAGRILDPDNGKVYSSKIQLTNGGKKLNVRGYIGCWVRSQTWERPE